MSLPARIFDFAAGTVIKSQEVDDELNQIDNILSGANIGKSIRVRNSDAAFACARFDQLGANNILELYADGLEVVRVEKDGDIVSPFLSSAAGIYTFTQIPLFPASDPTTGNQGTRKTYVDTRRIRWSAGFIYTDMSTRAVDSTFDSIQGAPVPGSNFVCTHVLVKPASGVASGSFTVEFRKVPSGSMSQTTLATITINPSSIGATTEVAVGGGGHTFTANDWLYPVISAVSSPGHKMVWVGFRGYQTTENP